MIHNPLVIAPFVNFLSSSLFIVAMPAMIQEEPWRKNLRPANIQIFERSISLPRLFERYMSNERQMMKQLVIGNEPYDIAVANYGATSGGFSCTVERTTAGMSYPQCNRDQAHTRSFKIQFFSTAMVYCCSFHPSKTPAKFTMFRLLVLLSLNAELSGLLLDLNRTYPLHEINLATCFQIAKSTNSMVLFKRSLAEVARLLAQPIKWWMGGWLPISGQQIFRN